jgi:general secretion pathway protein M
VIRDYSTGARRLAALAIGVLALLAGLAWTVAAQHGAARDALATIEPRHARLDGLAGRAPQVERALAERKAWLARHAYAASFDTPRAGSDAQQRARDLFTRAGLDVASTQVLPAKTVEGFERIPLVLNLEGDFAALHAALVVLASQSPTLFVEGMTVQGGPQAKPDAPQRVSVQANLFVLRELP